MIDKGISIIVLNLNGAKHVERLLSSFLRNNTYQPVEFIFVDHGSTDSTFEMIAQYAAKVFIRVIKRAKNYSFSSSCNMGAEKARYKKLLFLNNDIIFTSDILPVAEAKLKDERIGAVGVRLDDDPHALPKGKTPAIQHSGITFEWDNEKKFHRPVQIRHESNEQDTTLKSGYYPAVTGAFMLCRKSDFIKLEGFHEGYDYGFEDIDFCLQLTQRLNKKCWCINEMSLQHVDAASRKLMPQEIQSNRRKQNDTLFKKRMGAYIQQVYADHSKADKPLTLAESYVQNTPNSNTKMPTAVCPSTTLNILFVLYDSIHCNGGIHVQLFAERLNKLGAECRFAVPVHKSEAGSNGAIDRCIRTYKQIKADGPGFSNGSPPDIIHAWTPREKVRKLCESIRDKYHCPVIVHLEDNEEYLTEAAVGVSFIDLKKMPEGKLDKLIPENRYHPIKGHRFLDNAQGLTMIVDTLSHFNSDTTPSLKLTPPVDERLFYPRPMNFKLRRELNIPDNHLVLAYTGNVHTANQEEVRELYRAVYLLNQQGQPATLIRTGKNAADIGKEPWIKEHEKNLGWVDRSLIANILAAANVLVQPGLPGPFNDQRIPSKLPEFFSMGRPVILPRTNLGLKVEHGLEGYVLERADGENIATAVFEIGKDIKMAGKLAAGGRVFSQTKLKQADTADMIAFYADIRG